MTADVLLFPRSDAGLDHRGVILVTPAGGSRPTYLRALYRAAIGDTEIQKDPDGQLALTFDAPRVVRAAALNARVAQPPLGFALAVPVATPQELADALAVNQMDPHVRDTFAHKRSWALLVAVHGPVQRLGIGRALANRALDAVRESGGERMYLAARGRDAWIAPWLLERAFGRDGVTRELRPRTLFSRDVNFAF